MRSQTLLYDFWSKKMTNCEDLKRKIENLEQMLEEIMTWPIKLTRTILTPSDNFFAAMKKEMADIATEIARLQAEYVANCGTQVVQLENFQNENVIPTGVSIKST